MYTTIDKIHLDPTSRCNARCPQCARNFRSSPNENPAIELTEWSADEIALVLEDPAFAKVYRVLVNGNFGDIVMHSHPKELIQAIHDSRPNGHMYIQIHTNGGGLSTSFWEWLGTVPNLDVHFALDGLEDTHHLYRRNTRYDTVVKNARAFINAGGRATWVMTVFEHNEHQVEECKRLSEQYGFEAFVHRHSIRFSSQEGHNVYDENFNVSYRIKPSSEAKKKVNKLYGTKIDDREYIQHQYELAKIRGKVDREFTIPNEGCKISCYAKEKSDIFLSHDKQLLPCCYLGIGESQGHFDNKIATNYYNMVGLDPDYNNPLKRSVTTILQSGLFQFIEQSWQRENIVAICARSCNTNNQTSRFNLKRLNSGRVHANNGSNNQSK